MKKSFYCFILLFYAPFMVAQKTLVKGIVKNTDHEVVAGVNITYLKYGTTTNEKGQYTLEIPEGEITLTFSHVSYHTHNKTLTVIKNKTVNYSPVLRFKTEEIEETIIKNHKKEAAGITNINIEKVKKLPGANAGVENLLMTFAGVNNNNELSTQYNVRGGNFDENLVYVNGIEIYRPFLVRSGQQEGLSFINTQMAQNISFSAGGFQAKYGDKLSSVLDITYRTPKKFRAEMDINLLGAGATIEGIALQNKLSALLGVRFRDNGLLVNSKDIETNYHPKFMDVQLFSSYRFNEKLKFDFLGNFSSNNYNYTPISRRTKFGTFTDPLELIVYYNGQEKDLYRTLFGAINTTYKYSEELQIRLTTSLYNTQEEERYDILASYNIGEVNNDLASEYFGEVEFSEGIGSQLNHGRNDLDALIGNIQLKATYKKNTDQFDFGIKVQREDIKDRIVEWEMIDSVGFSVRPPGEKANSQPYEPYTAPIVPFQNVRAENHVKINRFSGFAQWSRKTEWNTHRTWFNIGLRAQHWNVDTNNKQTIVSPRAQFAIKPDWEQDMLFRISGGFYYQPPFYKELRDANGTVHPEVKAQRSIHAVIGNDYSFNMWNRPFKLVTEVYYKNLTNVNPYTVDNVRIRYAAHNNATAFASGIDIRINGEFVPGKESWMSFGYLNTKENINGKGYIPRPTDQRLKFGILFQDYAPNLPDLKVYLNLVYNTGLPGGSPFYTDPYNFQNRLKDYKRADIGVNYTLIGKPKKQISSAFKELTAGVELYNMFDIQNSITNTWVRDVYSKQLYGIPNYMTGRVLNFKLEMRF